MNTIDTRDLVERLDELEEEIELAQEQQLKIKELQDEVLEIETIQGYCPDFNHGATLIHEDSFEDYARELAEDIGAIDSEANWPLGCIDWKRAAEELSTDYSLIDYRGDSYYVR